MATTRKTQKSSGPSAPAPIYSMSGASVGTIELPAELFGAAWRADLVHQVATALAANKRQNRAHTKDRAEVAGGGKKPWKQKGTGQARHGSTRSPIWRHGGVTFGPRKERDYSEKVNKKMRAQALASVLSKKAQDGELILVEKLSFAAPKTKEAVAALAALGKGAGAAIFGKRKNAMLLALARYDANVVKSLRNVGAVATEEARNLNPLDLLTYRYLVIEDPEESFKQLAAKFSKK
ncbi:MAG TPA: 50S ribosomal protein L4 [Candidatus Paceibacterota bacterium]|nr:50S ribosomal protein L4 [Candidatus Paceibacterota bacterium]